MAVGDLEESRFLVDERIVRPHRHPPDHCRLLERVVDERDAAQKGSGRVLKDDPRRFQDHATHLHLEALLVDLLGTGLLAEADDHHLADPALHLAGEPGVGLDPIHDHDAVGLARIAVEVDGKAGGRDPDPDDLHRGADRGPDRLFGDAVVAEHLDLAGCGSAAVAPHAGHHEGLRPRFPDRGRDFPHRNGKVRDAPTAAGDGDPLAGTHGGQKWRHLAAGGGGNVRLAGAIEVLADPHQGRDVAGRYARLAVVQPEGLAKCYRGAQVLVSGKCSYRSV